jgi:hypothetical protein
MNEEPLATKALGEHQAIDDADMRTVIETLMGIIKNPKANYRSKTAAARVLAMYKRLNLDSIKTAATIEMGDLQERLEDLEERNAQDSL